jgi:tetratricopeptide (TPR) repeat protein
MQPELIELTERTLRDGLREHARRADRAGRAGRWDQQARELTVVAMAYNRLGRPDSALAPAAAATALLARTDHPATVAGVRATYGESLQNKGRHAEALAQYDTALQRLAAPRTGELLAERARLCTSRGSALLALGDVDGASAAYAAALALRHTLGDVAGEALVIHNSARLLQVVGRPDSSLTLFQASLALRERAPDAAAEAVTLNAVGYSYDLLGHPDSALVQYDRALARLGGTNVTLEGLSLMNRGRSRLALGDVDGAERDFKASRALVRVVGDAVGERPLAPRDAACGRRSCGRGGGAVPPRGGLAPARRYRRTAPRRVAVCRRRRATPRRGGHRAAR